MLEFWDTLFFQLPNHTPVNFNIYMQAKICGRSNIVKDDIRCIFFPRLRFSDLFTKRLYFLFRDMTELFMDAKSSATMLRENSAKYML